MHLPIGISDFSKLITVESDSGAGYLFVDKSLLIKEIVEKEGKKINLTNEAKLALKPINKSNYIAELKLRGITKICCMGIAFSRKEVKIATNR